MRDWLLQFPVSVVKQEGNDVETEKFGPPRTKQNACNIQLSEGTPRRDQGDSTIYTVQDARPNQCIEGIKHA